MIDPEKIELIPTSWDVAVPFKCDSTSKFVAGQIVRTEGHYWQAKWEGEFDSQKYGTPGEALVRLLQLVVDAQDLMFLQSWQEFAKDL